MAESPHISSGFVTRAEPSVLDRIVAAVRARLDAAPEPGDLAERAARIRAASQKRSLREALSADGPSIIAECKKASPSAGLLRADFDPARLAARYQAAGAAAISVVTERDFFQGRLEWLAAVREVVDLPVLRKDFIIDERQLREAAALGADAVLLIQRILRPIASPSSSGLPLRWDWKPSWRSSSMRIRRRPSHRGLGSSGSTPAISPRSSPASMPSRPWRIGSRPTACGSPRAVSRTTMTSRGFVMPAMTRFLIGEHLVRADDPERALVAARWREW